MRTRRCAFSVAIIIGALIDIGRNFIIAVTAFPQLLIEGDQLIGQKVIDLLHGNDLGLFVAFKLFDGSARHI